MPRAAIVTVLLALAAGPLAAQEADNLLVDVEAFACTFPVFAVARWEGGEPTVRAGTDALAFRFEEIDHDRRRASLVATGRVLVTATLTPTGLNLIEQTPDGNFILTTIFTSTTAADTYHAVHARHLGDPATVPSASQFHGTCTVAD